jgi:hypothetical protein
VDNAGLSTGDKIDLLGNPLSSDSLNTYIPVLEAKGVNILYEASPNDTTPPTMTSVFPEDGTSGVSINTVISATFSEAMDSSTINTHSFTLTGSNVSGTVTYNPDTYTATFTPDSNLELGHEYTATLSVAIKDIAGNPLAEAYSWSFTTLISTYDISLYSGWNLISLPLIPDSTSIEDVLAGLDVQRVCTYDGDTQTWYLYSPGAPSDLHEMTHGRGYWVKVTDSCTLTIEGTAPQLPYDIPLFAGWNLIGLPLISASRSIEDVLAGITVDRVCTYDGETGTWYLYSPGAPSDLNEMTHGKAYWVRVSDPCILTIND